MFTWPFAINCRSHELKNILGKNAYDGLKLDEHYSIYKKITLEDVPKIAFANRQDLRGFIYTIEANWRAERAALSAFLPQFSIIADSGKSSKEDLSGISQYPKESLNFEINQLIFSLGDPMLRYKMAQEDTNISRAQKNGLENSVRFNSENSFLDLKKNLLKKELIGVLNESSQLTFGQNKTREKVGFLNKFQWENSKANFSQDQAEVKYYPSEVEIAVKYLERETNTDVHTELISLDYENIEKIKLLKEEQYCKMALENRPDLREKGFQIQKAQYSERFYKYKYIPEIYLTTKVQKARMVMCPPELVGGIPFDNTPLIWHVGLNISWNFDGLSNFNTSKQYDNLATSFSLQKKDLELGIIKEIQALHYEIETQFINLEAMLAQFKAAKTDLDNLKTQYDVGLVALYQLKQTETTYKKAEFDLISLKIAIRDNYQKLLFLCGYPKEICD